MRRSRGEKRRDELVNKLIDEHKHYEMLRESGRNGGGIIAAIDRVEPNPHRNNLWCGLSLRLSYYYGSTPHQYHIDCYLELPSPPPTPPYKSRSWGIVRVYPRIATAIREGVDFYVLAESLLNDYLAGLPVELPSERRIIAFKQLLDSDVFLAKMREHLAVNSQEYSALGLDDEAEYDRAYLRREHSSISESIKRYERELEAVFYRDHDWREYVIDKRPTLASV